MKKNIRALSALLSCALCAALLAPPALALDRPTTDAALSAASARVLSDTPAPQVGAVGGEWAVLGLARGGAAVPEGYYSAYLAGLAAYTAERKGILHERKYTEYARVVLAVSALGADARDVAGYDLTAPLGDYEKTVWQGINGPVWALIALDARDYPMPQNPAAKTQATRQMYLDHILSLQNPDGGWSLSPGSSDPDVTGMALQALAKYRDQPAVEAAVQSALSCMSARQDVDGGYSSWGVKNSESCVQLLVALCELGLPLDDPRFVKDGHTLLDALFSFRTADGGFLHTIPAGGSDQMATEQALYALTAVRRAERGESSLYRMADAVPPASHPAETPAGRDAAVRPLSVTNPGVTFEDLSGHPAQAAVEALAARGVVTGKSGNTFDPGGAVTRAEFAALAVRALGLPARTGETFSDVPASVWYASAVSTANAFGLVSGRGGGVFEPSGPVTRQEAAVMVTNAARLCGLDTAADERVLTGFTDRTACAQWARPALAFCYTAGLLDQADVRIRPQDAATRAETAQLLYRLLSAAALL